MSDDGHLTATSSDLNTAGATTDTRIAGVEVIDASGAGAGVLINLAAQTEGFTIIGSAFADTLTGALGADNISGGVGNDIINGFVGADTIDGGGGTADTIILTATSATLSTAGATDSRLAGVEIIDASGAAAGVSLTLVGQLEGFTVIGGVSADTITGGFGADSISTGLGNDVINGFVGADTVDGGGGTNTLLLTADLLNPGEAQLVSVSAVNAANATVGLTINLSSQSEGFTITSGTGADTLTGGGGGNIFNYVDLTKSLVASYDTINNVKATDTFKIGHAATALTKSLAGTGNVTTDMTTALTSGFFIASAAAVVTISSGADAGTYLAINDGTAGFQTASDAIIKLLTPVSLPTSNFIV